MRIAYPENPWYAPAGTWDRTSGNDVYQVPTHCPYCGELGRGRIVRYEGAWFRLRCVGCGRDYKIRGKCD